MPQRNPLAALSDLRIPRSDKMQDVMDALSDQGRAEFLSELYDALSQATETGDLASIQFVVDAWWVSRKFVQHPRFEKAVEAAIRSAETDKWYTPDEVQELLTSA